MFLLDEFLALKETLWPHITFYGKQIEIIDSVCRNDETYVPAGNQLGKDFVAGFVAVAAFILCHVKQLQCRIVTTSVAEHHLRVLWGEIGRFMTAAKAPLLKTKDNSQGVYVMNYQEIRLAAEVEARNPYSYLVGRVTDKDEGLAGHHADYTLFVGDEASGLADAAYVAAQGWAKRMLFLGNPNPCENFFRRACRDVAGK